MTLNPMRASPMPKKKKPVAVPPCDLCKEVQTELGAVLYGPPGVMGLVAKWHVCVPCYSKIVGQ
jgi:hypothetical protein